MITVLEAIKLSTEYLAKKNIESPRTNAEILLSEILKCKRLELYLSFDKPLSEFELDAYRQSIKKRSLHIPLQYIVGNVDFFDIKLKVNENVLIPRPETELLVEKIINDFREKENLRILDIGCGSGNISISLAKNLLNSSVLSIDISEKAIETAIGNSELNKITNITFMVFDVIKSDVSNLGKFDIIVSNPPYISKIDFDLLEPELKEYEPTIALTDLSDGLTFYKEIISKAENLLNKHGWLYFEMGKGQCSLIQDYFISAGFTKINISKDYAGIERIISGELN